MEKISYRGGYTSKKLLIKMDGNRGIERKKERERERESVCVCVKGEKIER